MAAGCSTGGILKLRELISEHPAELAYDFRSRFNLSIHAIGYTLRLDEAVMLVAVLLRDPSSWLQAAKFGWKHPVSREWEAIIDHFDLTFAVAAGKKAQPYPRPWPDANKNVIGGKGVSRADVIERLRNMNPKEQDG